MIYVLSAINQIVWNSISEAVSCQLLNLTQVASLLSVGLNNKNLYEV